MVRVPGGNYGTFAKTRKKCLRKGIFTVSISVSICVIAKKFVAMFSIVLFTLSDAKHLRENR